MKVSKNFVPVDVSFIKGDEEIARFCESALKGVDNDARPLNGGVVYFPRMGLERADQIQMGSRTQEVKSGFGEVVQVQRTSDSEAHARE